MKQRCALLSAIIIFSSSIATADDHDTLFTPSEVASLAGMADEIRKKQRQMFSCPDHETHQACVARHCNLDLVQLEHDGDTLAALNAVGKFTDEQVRCIFAGSDHGEAIISFRKVFRAGLLATAKPKKEQEGGQVSPIDQYLESLNDIYEEDVSFTPPLTSDELAKFRDEIEKCWQISDEKFRVTVVVAVSFTEDAEPIPSSIRLVSYSGGDQAAAEVAFAAGRNAIMLCGGDGYSLPADKFERWQETHITFDTEKLSVR